MKNKFFLSVLFSVFIVFSSIAQTRDVSKLTRDEILALSYDELAEMPLEDVMQLTKILGVSLNELYEMLLNKDVTSASKKAESSFVSPLSTTVISYDEIVASGARNIQEALRLVPGVISREKTNGNYDIHIRGNDNIPDNNLSVYSENSMTLVMVNSRPVYNYVNGGTFWESLPVGIADLDRIEVVRGAVSALYGANAVTGVINIITKTPDSDEFHVNGQIQGGNLGSYMGSINLGQNVGKFGYRISGNYQKMQRTTDKLYVFEYDSLFDKDDIADGQKAKLMSKTYPWIGVWNGTESIDDWYDDPKTAIDKMGANVALYYNMSDDVNFSLTGGYQNSYVTSSSFGDPPVSVTAREMNGVYGDFVAKVKGLSFQANLLSGTQDIVRGNTGFKVDNMAANVMAEYDFNFGSLNLRPGVSYQMAQYDDTPYLEKGSDGKYSTGYLNDKVNFKSYAGSLRADYKALDDKLRLIGALRVEKFNVADKIYLPFQLVASYNVRDKHMLRIVGSSANRSPFIVDSYSNFEWRRNGKRPVPNTMKFNGNKDQNLAQTKMVEFGYRFRPLKNLSFDFEAFASLTKDFGCLLPDSLTVLVALADSANYNFNHPQYGMIKVKQAVPAKAIPDYASLTYQNIDLKSQQVGLTLKVEWVATEKLFIKLFGTLQQTKMKDYTCYNNSQVITNMATDAATTFATDYYKYSQTGNPAFSNLVDNNPMNLTNGTYMNTFFTGAGFDPIPSASVYTTKTDYVEKTTVDHKATPSFYGGFGINYSPIEKLNIYGNGYFYSKQTFENSNGTFDVDPKIIINCKISYKIIKDNAVFFNARNLLNSSKQEFAWLDETKGCYLFGLDLKF